jgi:hypothetical protein
MNERLYLVTDINDRTHGNMLQTLSWGAGVSNNLNKIIDNQHLYGYHFPLFDSIQIAELVLPALQYGVNYPQVSFRSIAKIWECQTNNSFEKTGSIFCTSRELTSVQEVKRPIFSSDDRSSVAIKCALGCNLTKSYLSWGNRWLQGDGRDDCETAQTVISDLYKNGPKSASGECPNCIMSAHASILSTGLGIEFYDQEEKCRAFHAALAIAKADGVMKDINVQLDLPMFIKNLVSEENRVEE